MKIKLKHCTLYNVHGVCSVVRRRTIAIEILSVGAFAWGFTGGQAPSRAQLLQSPDLVDRASGDHDDDVGDHECYEDKREESDQSDEWHYALCRKG